MQKNKEIKKILEEVEHEKYLMEIGLVSKKFFNKK